MRPTSSMRGDNSILNDKNSFGGNHFLISDSGSSILANNKSINKSIMKKTFTIDSMFRSNYDNPNNHSHDYIIDLPETITNAVTMSISSIEIPLSYHNISEEANNNILKITFEKYTQPNNKIYSWDLVLSSGLYEAVFISDKQLKAQDIKTYINEQIKLQLTKNDSDPDDTTYEKVANSLEFDIDKKSGFGVFRLLDNFDIAGQIIIDFNVDNATAINRCSKNYIYQKLGWQLGFREEQTILDIPGDGTTSETVSSGICHISYPRYVYICVDDFQTSSRNFFAVASDSIIAPNIVARINILSCLEEKTAFKTASAPGDYLYTNKHIREYFGPTNIKKLRIQLLDEYGRNLSLNNMDWSFVASWESLYN